uniref:Uncharacterized protein n=1 Tax=Oryza meyeriana var. granulata TaxID=110450 RepID=A0A1V1H7B1_9ORYZ|nr:hypothetical protein [Oryza meyeriana var. granulata]
MPLGFQPDAMAARCVQRANADMTPTATRSSFGKPKTRGKIDWGFNFGDFGFGI